MKKLIAVILLVIGFEKVFCMKKNFAAENISVQQKDSLPQGVDTVKLNMDDYVIRQAGKMVLVKSKMSQPLKNDITMNDGSIVRLDGTLIKVDGKSYLLNEGDKVYISGIVEAPKIN